MRFTLIAALSTACTLASFSPMHHSNTRGGNADENIARSRTDHSLTASKRHTNQGQIQSTNELTEKDYVLGHTGMLGADYDAIKKGVTRTPYQLSTDELAVQGIADAHR